MDGENEVAAGVPDTHATNEIATIATIFANPQRTVLAMAEKPRFWAGLIVTILVMAALGVLIFQSGIVRDETIAKMEAQGAPEAQIDATAKMFDSPMGTVFALGGNLLGVPFSLLVSAALLLFMGNLLLGAKLRFPHYLSAVVYGSVVGLVDHAIRAALVLSKGSLDIRLGIGNLFGEELNYVTRVLDSMTDPFLVWGMAVTALGVATYARKGFAFGIIATLTVFVATLLLSGMR
jgi:hypothetical protein